MARPIVWLGGEIRSPPLSRSARIDAGALLRRLQDGEVLAMPHCRPMPSIGPRRVELRIPDRQSDWRIVLRIDPDAIVILDLFAKKSRATPDSVMKACRRRLRNDDSHG